jgi:hypothetical protein
MRNLVVFLNARKYHTFYEECVGVRQHDVGGLGMYVIFQHMDGSAVGVRLMGVKI